MSCADETCQGKTHVCGRFGQPTAKAFNCSLLMSLQSQPLCLPGDLSCYTHSASPPRDLCMGCSHLSQAFLPQGKIFSWPTISISDLREERRLTSHTQAAAPGAALTPAAPPQVTDCPHPMGLHPREPHCKNQLPGSGPEQHLNRI